MLAITQDFFKLVLFIALPPLQRWSKNLTQIPDELI